MSTCPTGALALMSQQHEVVHVVLNKLLKVVKYTLSGFHILFLKYLIVLPCKNFFFCKFFTTPFFKGDLVAASLRYETRWKKTRK